MLLGTLRVLLRISLRNIFSHKVTSLIVGGIIGFGTFLVVLGTAMLDSIETSMAKSVTSSLAGHLQVYSSEGRDSLALFGSGVMAMDDIGEIEKVGETRKAIEALPNVEALVPQGLNMAMLATGNSIDNTINELRTALRKNDAAEIELLKSKLISIAHDMEVDRKNRLTVSSKKAELEATLLQLATIQTPAFWSGLATDQEATLTYLDTKLAPLYEESHWVFLFNLGTDLPRFTSLFSAFKLKEGQMVPEGERGFLMSAKTYQDFIKNKVARELDRINRERTQQHKTIATDPKLTELARDLPSQYKRVLFDVNPADVQALTDKLRTYLKKPEGKLEELMREALSVNDASFDERYKFFYDEIAPRMVLHFLKVGDTITLQSMTQAGYPKSVNVKLYGIYEFEGLESSDLAGQKNLIDLVSFRELYGVMTDAKRAELKGIRDQVGVKAVAREGAEDALFGDSGSEQEVVKASDKKGFDEFAGASLAEARREAVSAAAQRFTQDDIDNGLALNAAVILKDPSKIAETKAEIEALSEKNGMKLKVVNWQEAAGIVGQLIVVVRLVLVIAIFIIFLVALVIINNSMVTATMERVAEIGTMRAIGAQRGFVLVMFLFETLMLGAIAGGLGALAGAGVITALGNAGIPATHDMLVFLFSGPKLYPTFTVVNLVTAAGVVLGVSLISTLYPARIATRIQPIVAMQGKT